MNVEISTIVDGNIPKYLMIWLILYQSESSPYSLPRRRSPSPRATNRSARCWRKQRNIRRQCLSLLSCGNDDDIYIRMDRWSSWSRLNMECAEKTSLKWEYGWICYILSTPGLQDDISYLYIHTHTHIYIYIHTCACIWYLHMYIYMYIYIVISCYVYII